MKQVILFGLLVILACSSSNGPDQVPDLDETFFPIGQGNTWYYTSDSRGSVVRLIDGDTTIGGRSCLRVLENGQTAETWSIKEGGDTAGFYVHLLSDEAGTKYRFEPPLRIPFNMEPGEIHYYSTRAYFSQGGQDYYVDIEDSLKFVGFVSKSVPAGQFKDVARLHYITDNYYEYYAPGVGLLDNDDYLLDSALIGGAWIR